MLLFNKRFFFLCFIFMVSTKIYSLQFGNGNDKSSDRFINVASDVKDISIGGTYTAYIIKSDNSLWGTGNDVYADFKGISKNINKFEQVDSDIQSFDGRFLRKNKDSSVYDVWSGLKKMPSDFYKGSGLFVIKKDNSLWVSGENDTGSLGTGILNAKYDTPVKVMNKVLDVYYKYSYSLVITENYDLLISGKHFLPAPYHYTTRFVKFAENVRFVIDNFYITNDDELYVFGWCGHGESGLGDLGEQDEILPTKIMDNVESVAVSAQATLILKKDGVLYGCGGDSPNYCGELGLGNRAPVFIPTFIMTDVKKVCMGRNWSMVLKNDGTVWMAGANNEWEGGL